MEEIYALLVQGGEVGAKGTEGIGAPFLVLKQPEIFCLTLGMRTACSARLLVKGT